MHGKWHTIFTKLYAYAVTIRTRINAKALHYYSSNLRKFCVFINFFFILRAFITQFILIQKLFNFLILNEHIARNHGSYKNFIFNLLHVEGILRCLSLKTLSLNYHYDYRSYRYNIISAILVNKSFNQSICQKISRKQNCTLYTIPKHYFMILSKHIKLAVNE